MGNRQNAIEHVTDQMQQGKMTAAEANVIMVQIEGVRIVNGKIPSDVRKALNAAVKVGELGHIKKDGLQPEVYHHKNARGRAIEERRRIQRDAIASIAKINVPHLP
jgi:hypothetical protein